MRLKLSGAERVFRASGDGAEGVVLCLNPKQRGFEGAVHDTLYDTLGNQAELERTQPFQWVLLAHHSGERFERTCQRAIDTLSALGIDLELLELDHAQVRFDLE
jgi:hypothetical protein